MSAFTACTYTSADGLDLFYRDYHPDAAGPPLLCLHGLTRNSADFEDFARIFSTDYRVVAADVRGRGNSQWADDAEAYAIPTYVRDVLALADAASLDKFVVVGTSMGGLIGMSLAAAAHDRLAGIVLNDIGAELAPEGLNRIGGYVGRGRDFTRWEDAADALRALNEPFFPDFTAADWLDWAKRLFRQRDDGVIVFDYDPRIAESLSTGATVPTDLWAVFDALADIPTLVVRGELSDILTRDTVQAMKARKPDLATVEVPNRGHAPILNEPAAVDAIATFLKGLSI